MRKAVQSGWIHSDQITVSPTYCHNPNTYATHYASTNSHGSVLEYNWVVEPDWSFRYYLDTKKSQASIDAGYNYSVAKVHARNQCGWTSGGLTGTPKIHYLTPCGGYYSYVLSPNSVDSELNLTVTENINEDSKAYYSTLKPNLLYDVLIYDENGNLKLTKKSNSSTILTIDLQGFKPGNYILHVESMEQSKSISSSMRFVKN